jgi:hypothetical protein
MHTQLITLSIIGNIILAMVIWENRPSRKRERDAAAKEWDRKNPPTPREPPRPPGAPAQTYEQRVAEWYRQGDPYAKWSNPYDQPSMDESPRDDRR